jgi:gamma-glutamylcysteine synthetase
LEKTAEEMRKISRQILDATTVGVMKRKDANSDGKKP